MNNAINPLWLDKPYYSLNAYFKHVYSDRCYKISIDGGFTCPNRDGTLGTNGCIFCSESGSGDFSTSLDIHSSITCQISTSISQIKARKKAKYFIAYFQAFTSTYGPIDKLYSLFNAALSHDEIIGISIGTRPDCLDDDVLLLLAQLREKFPDKFIWVELGLQTIHDKTAVYIRRCYPLAVFDKAMEDLANLHIPTIIHLILGLPDESNESILESVRYLNKFKPFGVKFQLLHVLKDTDLATDYHDHKFEVLNQESYIKLLADCIANTHPDCVIHRVTGDGPKELLIAPTWSSRKIEVLNALHKYLKKEQIYQGKYLKENI